MRKSKKLVKGIGINDVDLPTYIDVDGVKIRDPFYLTWSNMLSRCHNPDYQGKRPTYIGCSICDEWLYFSNFRNWMLSQNWKGMQLDKDLLVGGNKVYSPETCLFIPIKVNASLVLNNANRGDFPIGCSLYKPTNRYKAECYNGKQKKIYLGYFSTPLEAHRAWQEAKINCLDELKDSQSDFLIKIGLQRIIDKIQNDYDNKRETKDFD